MNVKWLGDILLGNFEALQQTQYGCYTTFGLQDPFAPTPHLVVNLLGKQANSLWPWAGAPTLLLASGSGRFLSHLLFPLHAASHCTEPRSFVGLYFCLLFLWTLRSGRNTRKPFDLVFQASSHLTSSVRNGTPCPPLCAAQIPRKAHCPDYTPDGANPVYPPERHSRKWSLKRCFNMCSHEGARPVLVLRVSVARNPFLVLSHSQPASLGQTWR